MSLELSFRLTLYLSLGLACACLTYAEFTVLPESLFFAGIVATTLLIAFVLEGRWALSLTHANLLGLLISGIVGLWVAFRVSSPPAALNELPPQLLLMPYFGPVLMVAMAAKLLRPKDAGDYWTLHAIALVMVGLAGAMSESAVFLLLMLAYAFVVIWNLTLFYLTRVGMNNPTMDQNQQPVLGWAPWLRRASVWALLSLMGGFLFFLLTPRSPGDKWNTNLFEKSTIQVGYTEEAIDLNRTGDLRPNPAIAFRVMPRETDGRIKRDLTPSQYWRGRYYGEYSRGTWRPMESRDNYRIKPSWLPATAVWSIPLNEALPDFGPNQYQLDFTMQDAGGGNILASPIWWEMGERPPIATTYGPVGSEGSWYPYRDGTFTPRNMRALPGQRYTQLLLARPEPELSPPVAFEPNPRVLQLHLTGPTGRIADRTREIIRQLIDEQRLPEGALTRPHDHAEPVARELSRYLETSGEFSYSTRLMRQDPDLDPVEDFLLNTKSGHCNRFATALALMLRSAKIPTRLVVGYQGAEIQEDGSWVVRESHAHAWVEALIHRPATPEVRTKTGETVVAHWLRLDPSPEATSNSDAWWLQAHEGGQSFLREYVFGYDAERREETTEALWAWMKNRTHAAWNSIRRGEWTAMMVLGGLAMLGVLGLARLTGRHSLPRRVESVPIYAKLLKCLARHGFVPSGPSQTPLEFTEQVGQELCRRPGLKSLASLPKKITELVYRDRFGAIPLDEAENTRLEEELLELERALRSGARSVTT